jgi:hypothetical protein
MRNEFTEEVKRTLADRVNHFCSNPDCRAQTRGPQVDPTKAINVGVAAHMSAASPGGPRFDPQLSAAQRSESTNGIWLCQNCGKIIDNDPTRYSANLLRAWKMVAEDYASHALGRTLSTTVPAHLHVELSRECIKADTYERRRPVRMFVLSLRNELGTASAKYPSIRYKRKCGLVVDHFGIDGFIGIRPSPTSIPE